MDSRRVKEVRMNLGFAEERRLSPRVPLFSQAVVRAAGRHVPCTTVDLSTTGMLLLPAASARPGLALRVVFQVENDIGPVDLAAVLTREGEYQGTYAWGIRFVNVPARVSSQLQFYVHHLSLSERDSMETPPLGVDSGDPNEKGQYLRIRRRYAGRGTAPSITAPSITEKPIDEQPRESTSTAIGRPTPPEASTSSSGLYRQVGAVTQDRVWGARPDSATHPAIGSRTHSVMSQPNGATGSSSNAGAAIPPSDKTTGVQYRTLGKGQAPSLNGLGAVTGQGLTMAGGPRVGMPSANQTGIGHYAQAGAKRTTIEQLEQTGPPRRGANSAMHHTGPKEQLETKRRSSRPELSRRSSPTPLEVRELYQAALEEIDGKPGRKKRPSGPMGNGSKNR